MWGVNGSCCADGAKELIADTLKRGKSLDEKNYLGMTALMFAAQHEGMDCDEVFSLLIEAGADVNAADKKGKTVLMWAVSPCSNAKNVQKLIDAGADVRARNKDGETVLAWAHGECSVLLQKIMFGSK